MPLDFISVMLNCYLALRKSSIIHQRVKFELYQEEHADTHFFLKNLPKISRNRTQTITRSLILIITFSKIISKLKKLPLTNADNLSFFLKSQLLYEFFFFLKRVHFEINIFYSYCQDMVLDLARCQKYL